MASELTLADVVKFVDLLEVDKIAIHQFVDTFKASDVACLIHLIELTKCDKHQPIHTALAETAKPPTKTYQDKTLLIGRDYVDICKSTPPSLSQITKSIHQFAKRYLDDASLKNIYRYTVPLNIYPKSTPIESDVRGNRMEKIYISPSQQSFQRITIMDIYNRLIEGKQINGNVHCKHFCANLQTSMFASIAKTVEALQTTAVKTSRGSSSDKFVDYINTMKNKRDDFKIIPKPNRCYKKLPLLAHEVALPYYCGIYCLIVIAHGNTTIYNRYGDTITGLKPQNLKFEKSALVEAVIMCEDKAGNLKNWSYYHLRKRTRFIYTDLYIYSGINLWTSTPVERQRMLTNLMIEPQIHTTIPKNVDEDSTVAGVLVKQVKSLNSYAWFLPTIWPTYDWCTAIIYSHSSFYYFICVWNNDFQKFVHWCTVEREFNDYKTPTYVKSGKLFVVAAQNKVFGYSFIRLYKDGTYAIKPHGSRYDVYCTDFQSIMSLYNEGEPSITK